MLSPRELASLLSILSDEDKSLEAISLQFHKIFSKADQFKVGCCLYMMIQQQQQDSSASILPKLTHRLASFYILYELYRTEPFTANPFLPIFVETLQRESDP